MAELTLPTIDALERHRVGLRGHCYRMLGSPSEADDAVQDALLKGWQKRDTFAGEERALKSWLYRIATRVCLDLIEARGRRALPWNLGPPAGLDAALIERPASEWLEPVPDALVVPDDVNPAERVILKQSVRLAFLAALQHLPGRQRAALLLTEVLDWSAAEVAECIECSVPAVNSALQRARDHRGAWAGDRQRSNRQRRRGGDRGPLRRRVRALRHGRARDDLARGRDAADAAV